MNPIVQPPAHVRANSNAAAIAARFGDQRERDDRKHEAVLARHEDRTEVALAVGARIRAERLGRDLTQADVERRSEGRVTRGAVAAAELGRVLPSSRTLIGLAIAMPGLDVHALLMGEDATPCVDGGNRPECECGATLTPRDEAAGRCGICREAVAGASR